MTLYLDTSLLVAAFTPEAASDRATILLKNSPAERLLISEWVRTEFSAALSMKMRTKAVDHAQRAEAIALFSELVGDSMETVAITAEHFRTAAEFSANYRLGLRAPDALHLAVASSEHATLCTLDKQLAKAGKALGVAARLI